MSTCPKKEVDFRYQESLEQHVKTLHEGVMQTHFIFEIHIEKTNAFPIFTHQESFKNTVNSFDMIKTILMYGKQSASK